MQLKWLEQKLTYDGSQLSPHWILKNHQLVGNTMVAFAGPCDVLPEKMVDLVDRNEGKKIRSEEMLHFIVEFFGKDLVQTILLQRLLVSLAQQEIMFRTKNFLIRSGNDLFDGESKLSVSIATASPVSTLIHFGINISSKNTPVKTRGLSDYGIDPQGFAKSMMETFKHEVETVETARSKVKAVTESYG